MAEKKTKKIEAAAADLEVGAETEDAVVEAVAEGVVTPDEGVEAVEVIEEAVAEADAEVVVEAAAAEEVVEEAAAEVVADEVVEEAVVVEALEEEAAAEVIVEEVVEAAAAEEVVEEVVEAAAAEEVVEEAAAEVIAEEAVVVAAVAEQPAIPVPQSGPKIKKKRLPRTLRPQKTRPTRTKPAERLPIVRLEKPEHERGRSQERQGTVVSAAMDKTIVVKVEVTKSHRKYKKVVRRSVKFHAHDEGNSAKLGDVVRIVETRPLSATKRWRLTEIVEVAK